MKIAVLISRVLLGLIFVVFGLNIFFNFIHMPPPASPSAGAFVGAMYGSGYLYAVKLFEIVGGLLLLTGFRAPLGLVLVGPVVVNILFYDLFLDRAGLPLGLLIAVLSLVVLAGYRQRFSALVAA